MSRRCFIAALLALGLAGCFGDTAILLQIILPPATEAPDEINVVVTGSDNGDGVPTTVVNRPFGDLLIRVTENGATAELALVPGAEIEAGDVLIDVAVAARNEVQAAGSVAARLEPHRVNKAIVNLEPVPCDDDPFEGADLLGGSVINDIIYPVIPDLTLCPEDDHDGFWTFVPAGWSVHYEIVNGSPNQPLQVTFMCFDGGGEVLEDPIGLPVWIGPLPVADAEGLLEWWVLPEDASCGVHVERLDEPGREAATANYLLALDVFDLDIGDCLDEADPLSVIDLGTSSSACSELRWSCSAPDFFDVLVPRGLLMRADVIPMDGSDPSEFPIEIICPDVEPPDDNDPARHPGLAISPTGPLSAPAGDACFVTVSGPFNSEFELCVETGDHDECVPDLIDDDGSGDEYPLVLGVTTKPFAVCDDDNIYGAGQADADHFRFSTTTPRNTVCVDVWYSELVPPVGGVGLSLYSLGAGAMPPSLGFNGAVSACLFAVGNQLSGQFDAKVFCVGDSDDAWNPGCGFAYTIEASAY